MSNLGRVYVATVSAGPYGVAVTLAAPGIQNYGEVFTRRWVVEVLLNLTGYTVDRDLGSLHLVEPSCGSGAFLGPVVERLIESAQTHGRALASLGQAIRAYDLQPEHVEVSRALCRDLLITAGVPVSTADELAKEWVDHADFLLAGVDVDPADVVIGNPPYIRYDDLSDDLAAWYRSTWLTMRGRGDIYVGFIERSLRLLKPGGKVGLICADRWMRNQYGADLRELVARDYAVEHIWMMHDVDAFDCRYRHTRRLQSSATMLRRPLWLLRRPATSGLPARLRLQRPHRMRASRNSPASV